MMDDAIENFNEDNIQPASYDLTNHSIDDKYDDWVVQPGECRKISTLEWVNMPEDVAGMLKTKSSLARLGIIAGDVGGWIDPGFKGNITITVINNGDRPVDLADIESTTQIVFLKCTGVSEKYNGNYQNSNGVQESVLKE